MTKNIGGIDWIIRIVVGLALAGAAYMAGGPAVYILGGASFVALLTGLIGWCGFYTLLGRNTCNIDDKP